MELDTCRLPGLNRLISPSVLSPPAQGGTAPSSFTAGLPTVPVETRNAGIRRYYYAVQDPGAQTEGTVPSLQAGSQVPSYISGNGTDYGAIDYGAIDNPETDTTVYFPVQRRR
ncbi:uncharacterized protein L203_106404 [Cryptococcus depauperatus CBS 7841]|uniref:Uncharacterized protein n=1 Tax=Cryptococcus depauperatus CBS 7841 TaxID=1295531 RepID=A0AAJ8M3E4_9TREE